MIEYDFYFGRFNCVNLLIASCVLLSLAVACATTITVKLGFSSRFFFTCYQFMDEEREMK